MQLIRTTIVLAALAQSACGGFDNGTCTLSTCTPAANTYAVEVVSATSASGQMLPDTDFDNVSLDVAAGSFAVQLPATAQVVGKITSGGMPVPATVVLTRTSHIPGRPDVSYQSTTDATGAYSLSVPVTAANETDTIRVQPTDSATFPPTSSSTQITGDQSLDFEIPGGGNVLTLHGVLSDALDVAVPGATVEIRDATSLAVLSTVAQTNVVGAFSLLLPVNTLASAGTLQLAVLRGDTSTGLVSLLVTLTPETLRANLVNAVMQLTLPALLSPSRLTLTVVGAGSNGINQPVPNAQVQLLAELADSSNSTTTVQHEVDGQTDANGQISVDLYTNAAGARLYAVNVLPGAASVFQSTSAPLTVGTPSGVSATIQLSTRPLVTGRVIDPSGNPVVSAVLQPQLATLAVALIGNDTSSLSNVAQVQTSTSDQNGRFALYLDPGNYQLGVIPPATAGLARLWLASRSITSDLDLDDISPPMAVMFSVNVADHGAAPVEATVRLYSVPASDLDCSPDDTACIIPPLLIAQGSSNAQGQAPVLLPAQ